MLKLFETQDGSNSLYSEKFGVSYHSKYGAIKETRHVFIEAGLFYIAILKKELDILDIGFGTGLTAFLTFLEAEKLGLQVRYTAVEAYPVLPEEADQLAYPRFLKADSNAPDFKKMHTAPWNAVTALGANFQLEKIRCLFEDLSLPAKFDLIYYDAFAPNTQPELWEEPLLIKMFEILKPGGILVTYAAKGVFKRTLKKLGFQVEALKGPPGKREMTRARKPEW